jgi:hypothetical protein
VQVQFIKYVVNTLRVEGGGAAHDAVHFIAFAKQQFC